MHVRYYVSCRGLAAGGLEERGQRVLLPQVIYKRKRNINNNNNNNINNDDNNNNNNNNNINPLSIVQKMTYFYRYL